METYTEAGDGVIMNTPAYGPLQSAILKNGRRMLSSPLKRNGDRYELDFDHMESLVDERTKMLIMCNPHNPTGRSWTREELAQAADFCKKHNLVLFSDEIHGDLTAEGVKHQSTLSPTNEELANGENWTLVNNGGSGAGLKVIDHKAIPIARIISRG